MKVAAREFLFISSLSFLCLGVAVFQEQQSNHQIEHGTTLNRIKGNAGSEDLFQTLPSRLVERPNQARSVGECVRALLL